MPSYKLIYFNGKGRAELSRLIFAEAGIEYEDFRIVGDEWPKIKPTTQFGKVPVLEVDGRQLAESGAIVRYLGKQFGLAGDDDFQIAQSDMVVEVLFDLISKIPMFEKDEKKKREGIEEGFAKHIIPAFENLEKMKVAGGHEFLIRNKITYADIGVFHAAEFLKTLRPDFLSAFPQITKLVESVGNRKGIKEWVKKRPDTQF